MKHKPTCLALAAAVLISASAAAFAAETEPAIRVDDRLIHFEDQKPVLLEEENRILIPARGVFEAMGATVEWRQETKKVFVDSYNNVIHLELNIGDPTMLVYTYTTSLLNPEKEEVALDAAPQLINDRTMIPLRAVSESLNAIVDWDQEQQLVDITTQQRQNYIESAEESSGAAYDAKTALPNLTLTADKETVQAGDTVTLSINLSNAQSLGDDIYYTGLTAGIFYDASKFSFTSYTPVVNGVTPESGSYIGGSNPSFKEDSLKLAYIFYPNADVIEQLSDGVIATVTFTALADGPAEFSLSDRITDRGYDTGLTIRQGEDAAAAALSLESSEELYIDTTPVQVN